MIFGVYLAKYWRSEFAYDKFIFVLHCFENEHSKCLKKLVGSPNLQRLSACIKSVSFPPGMMTPQTRASCWGASGVLWRSCLLGCTKMPFSHLACVSKPEQLNMRMYCAEGILYPYTDPFRMQQLTAELIRKPR